MRIELGFEQLKLLRNESGPATEEKKGKGAGQEPAEVPSAEQGELVENNDDAGVSIQASDAQDAPAVPTGAATPAVAGARREARYPSTAVLDDASRVSTATYAVDSGDGQVAEPFRYFANTVREAPGLSVAEREYYDIFFTYLLAAWAGRVDSTKLPPPTPPREIESFFE